MLRERRVCLRPDTSLVWYAVEVTLKQIVRAIEREARRQQQEHNRRQQEIGRQYREAQKHQQQVSKEFQKAVAASDVFAYEQYVRSLITLHCDGIPPLDWYATASTPAPLVPVLTYANVAVAQHGLNSYKPGLLERTLGGAKKRIAELELAILHAKATDEQVYRQACIEHQTAHQQWVEQCALASRTLVRDMGAYREVLSSWQVQATLEPFGAQIFVARVDPDVVQYMLMMDVAQNVPREQLSLTAAGKLSKKALAVGNYWSLCQDHVCSAALRLVRDTFALLPVDRVVVNAGGAQLNTSTGHVEPVTWLALHVPRRTFDGINLNAIDPSDAMVNFQHRMKFKKASGFTPVDPITTDDQWVTA